MLNWTIEKKVFKLRYNWKLSRNETTEKVNFFVRVNDEKYFGVGEIAPNIRYLESPESVEKEFELFLKNPIQQLNTPLEASAFITQLPISNCLKFGLESAALHYLAQKGSITTAELLGLPPVPDRIKTCYTIPVMPSSEVGGFIQEHNLLRFDSLKIKINQENALDAICKIATLTDKPLKIDANEAWTDPDLFLSFIEKIKNYPIEFIEQPFPASCVEEYIYVKKVVPFNLFADESVQNKIDYVTISQQFHGVNIKLMKAGGYLKAMELLTLAKSYHLKTMIGCMVESTLGISSAMNFASLVDYADLDGHFVIENEPFHLVNEENGRLFLSKK